MLDISKFESGIYAPAPEPLDLHSVISDTASIVLPHCKKKRLALRIHCDPRIDNELLGPPEEVKEVLVNLLGNAAKFTEAGHIALESELIVDEPDQVEIEFRIADTGPGIPAEHIHKIFEPFAQLDASITRQHGGTGLGTSFARELVRLMGGDISVESTVGAGTLFRIRLAFAKQNRTEEISHIFPLKLAVLSSMKPDWPILSDINRFGARTEYFDDPTAVSLLLTGSSSKNRFDAVLVNSDDFRERLTSVVRILNDEDDSRIVPVVTVGQESMRTDSAIAGALAHLTFHEPRELVRRALNAIASFSSTNRPRSDAQENNLEPLALKILVAEDDPTNRRIAKLILEEAGHVCTFVHDGDDALFELNDTRYDLALLDMHMPKRDGVEVAKLFNFGRFDRSQEVPIILFTADTTMEAKVEAQAAGITRFLSKPIRPSELLDAITTTYRMFHDTDEPIGMGIVPDSGTPADDQSNRTLNQESVADLLSFMTKEEQVQFFAEFEEDATEYIRSLEVAKSEKDVPAVQEKMHALSGAAITIGAEKLAGLAKKIELLDTSLVLAEKNALLAALQKCYNQTTKEINRGYLAINRPG